MKRLLFLAPYLVAFALPLIDVQACGPFFSPDVFVRGLHADHPEKYAAGKLGVLLPTYPRADLTVAYRYLNGGTLTAEEQQAYQPTLSSAEQEAEWHAEEESSAKGEQQAVTSEPADDWLKARAHFAPPPPNLHPVTEYDMVYTAGYFLAANYQNCQADAFRTAAATLNRRASVWGASSPALVDWIKGQDAVFSNCGIGVDTLYAPDKRPLITPASPVPAPANAPALLRQDRAYQIAAAQFYSGQFVPARASFQAIAQDKTSPWRGVACYLMARALIRQAFLTAKNGPDDVMASFNPDLMKQAQQVLESMRAAHLPGISPRAVESMLHLVRLRTQPQQRMREMSTALAGPGTDPYYQQDLVDFTWYLNGELDSLPIREDTNDWIFKVDRPKNDYSPLQSAQKLPAFEKAFQDVADLRSISPLIDWLVTFQSPSEAAKNHALAEWQRTGSTPWLLAAILKASPSDPSVPDLIDAAARVPPASPAWFTATYHRERLLIGAGKAQQAAAEIDANLPAIRKLGSESVLNLFTGLRMRSASTLDVALANAPRKILERTSEEQSSIDECLEVMKDPRRKYDCRKDTSPVELDEDAAAIFNSEMPLAVLAQSATSTQLPAQLRQSVAIMAWVRSVLLKNQPIAAQMLPLLPEKLQQQAGPGVGFHPLMAILRNAGLRPYLDGGVQRSLSYDFVESYSDNWWCGDWANVHHNFYGAEIPIEVPPVAFLSPQAQETGEKETAALLALGSAQEYLGSQVLDYVKAHPGDPDAPEALYLILRNDRYGCYLGVSANSDSAAEKDHYKHVESIALQVGAIMRRRYPSNPWTRKAAPFVWPLKGTADHS